jgi:molybdopterin synthase sulfur carrier subunit
MKVSVLFFGQTAEIAGTREIEISLDQVTTANQTLADILETYPKLKENKLLFALNQEYTDGDEIIKDGDELAIFTAVSGG